MITIDPTRSGEQLFKCDAAPAAAAAAPLDRPLPPYHVSYRSRLPFRATDAVLARLPPTFVDYLGESDSMDEAERVGQGIATLESHSGMIRQFRIECLKRHRDRLGDVIDSHTNRIAIVNQRLDQVCARPPPVRRICSCTLIHSTRRERRPFPPTPRRNLR